MAAAQAPTCAQWEFRCLEQLRATSCADSSSRLFGACEVAPSFTVTGFASTLAPASLFSRAYITSDLPSKYTNNRYHYCTAQNSTRLDKLRKPRRWTTLLGCRTHIVQHRCAFHLCTFAGHRTD